MYEDAACSRPCGAEPMGCATCAEIGMGSSYVDEADAYWDWMERDEPSPECPECNGEHMETEDGVNWRCTECDYGWEDEA